MKLNTEFELLRGAMHYLYAEIHEPNGMSLTSAVKRSMHNYANLRKVAKVQDAYDTSGFAHAKKVVVVLTPGEIMINGGVMSFFSIAETTRELHPDWLVVLSTYPGSAELYLKNDYFPNQEKIWRWGLVARNLKYARDVVIHIPEYCICKFNRDITRSERAILKGVRNLRLNVLNQNVWMMQGRDEVDKLRTISGCVTMSTAHKTYATQDAADQYCLPTIWLGTFQDYDKFKRYSFADKKKVIVLSPDPQPNKDRIVLRLKDSFPDFSFVTVNNMTYSQYIDLIASSYFTITFGEGWDGYFTEPHKMHSVGFAVYEKQFFPKDFDRTGFCQIFGSYDEMYDKIVDVMKTLLSDKDKYELASCSMHDKVQENGFAYRQRLSALYDGHFDFMPSEKV